MPFDPSTAKLKSSGFDPSTAQPKVSEATSRRSGYLVDPAEDEKAYLEAQRMYESRAQFPGSQVAERFADPFGFNLTRPMTGAAYWLRGKGIPVPGFQGEGYEFGKAVDRYYDDMVRAGAGSTASAIAETAGTLTSPSPVGKIIKGKGAVQTGARILGEGAIAAGEQQALSTENEQRNILMDALMGSLASGGTRALTGGGVVRNMPSLTPRAAERLAPAMARGGAAVTPPANVNLSGAPTAEELQRYFLQQMLQGGG